jgi:hypothetical protein
MISGGQIRAARMLLGITAQQLAVEAEVDWSTVQRFESTEGIPRSRSGTLSRIKETLEARGIVFIGDPVSSPGVQLQRPSQRPSKHR